MGVRKRAEVCRTRGNTIEIAFERFITAQLVSPRPKDVIGNQTVSCGKLIATNKSRSLKADPKLRLDFTGEFLHVPLGGPCVFFPLRQHVFVDPDLR
jgi:hypothetical protein